MRRAILRVVWVTVVFVTLLTVLSCSDGRPTVEDIQSEFESRGFEFQVWDFSVIGIHYGYITGISPDRGTILRINGQIPVKDVAWDSVELEFNSLAPWRYDVDLQVEYIIALASLLIPNMRDAFLLWLADAERETHTHPTLWQNDGSK